MISILWTLTDRMVDHAVLWTPKIVQHFYLHSKSCKVVVQAPFEVETLLRLRSTDQFIDGGKMCSEIATVSLRRYLMYVFMAYRTPM